MPSELHLAFGHPLDRSLSDTSTTPLDRISVRDYTVSVEIGAFQHERDVLQRVRFNVVVEVQPIAQDVDDDVDLILSYDTIIESIDAALKQERLNLLETVAERVAALILDQPLAARVFVRVEKLDRVPGALGVEIMRAKTDVAQVRHSDSVERPRVIFLNADAAHGPAFRDWIAYLADHKTPCVICIGLPDTPRIEAHTDRAQRTVALLSIDQNAWAVASQDERCVVVATKTELDWSMKNGRIAVWAPTKMILDAVTPPKPCDDYPTAAALWLAELVQAQDITFVGSGPTVETMVPIRRLDVGKVSL